MRRRRRRHRLVRLSPVADAAILLALGGAGFIALIYWPEHYLADFSFSLALIILFVTLRWA
jgi:hypothetical protein